MRSDPACRGTKARLRLELRGAPCRCTAPGVAHSMNTGCLSAGDRWSIGRGLAVINTMPPGLALPVKAARGSMLRQMLRDAVREAWTVSLCHWQACSECRHCALSFAACHSQTRPDQTLRAQGLYVATLESCWCLSARQCWSLSSCWVAQRFCLCLQAAGGCYHGCSAPSAPHRWAT